MFNAMLMRSRNKKGFTLMEMLIVVAIIAILVAVSFPVFTAQLNTAKLSTDQANVRAAKAVAVATYLTTNATITDNFYDAQAGAIVSKADGNISITKGYGQSENTTDTGATGTPKDKILKVGVDGNGKFTADWVPLTALKP